MQNCDEIPTLDLTLLEEDELQEFIYIVAEVCEQLSKENYILIKITRNG